ncbi:hypothetical protein OESDEN_19020 [Oesophagostomum dentatum]|uniref:Lysozyme n=1 Tax=Oesophagostomum dentatum TaxID=61180 RepID=A0A0B1S8M8_OESDE|nr:hypothetical protein OESDEN_19020 [Oesophagostomum dentatum]
MRIILLLASLIVACYARRSKTTTPRVPSTPMAYGVDLDKAISTDDFKCLKKKGYRAAFIRAYDPSGAGKFDDSARHNFYNAKKGQSAGLMTEMFMIPNPRSAKSGKTQFMELYKGLTANGIDVNRVFVQVCLVTVV